jgi:hypothetical protein
MAKTRCSVTSLLFGGRAMSVRYISAKRIPPLEERFHSAFSKGHLSHKKINVKEISDLKGYSVVVDRASAASIIYASPKIDISNEVLVKLGYAN